jgi:hypothetical protein
LCEQGGSDFYARQVFFFYIVVIMLDNPNIPAKLLYMYKKKPLEKNAGEKTIAWLDKLRICWLDKLAHSHE